MAKRQGFFQQKVGPFVAGPFVAINPNPNPSPQNSGLGRSLAPPCF
jgi:hypothetical protein